MEIAVYESITTAIGDSHTFKYTVDFANNTVSILIDGYLVVDAFDFTAQNTVLDNAAVGLGSYYSGHTLSNYRVCCMYGFETKLAILNNTLKGNARGGIYENIISECLLKRGYTLYYYKPDHEHEIEFLIEKNGEVVPVEVKAGNNPTVSLNNFIEDYSPSVAYKLIGGKNGTVGAKITLPHYFVMFI